MTLTANKREAATYADLAVTSGDRETATRAMAQLRLVCRRAGVDPEVLLAEARQRAAARPD